MTVAYCTKKPLLLVIGVTVLVRIFYLSLQYPLWWDSQVYVAMGKYIFSHGQLGFWESFRPLVHPLLLGALWKMGLNPILVGKGLDVLFSTIAVYLVYKIAEKEFNPAVALVSSLIFSLTATFIIFTGLVLSDPLALMLGLGGIFLVLQKRSAVRVIAAGVLLGLSFMTRFPQGILFAAVLVAWAAERETVRTKIRTLFFFSGGFAIPVIPYLLFNQFRYGSAWEPFLSGSRIVTTATWLYGSGGSFYFVYFFLPNLIYCFSFYFLYLFFKEKQWKKTSRGLIFLLPALTIFYFMTVPRKEVRYLVSALPFLAMMSASALNILYCRLKQQTAPLLKPRALVIIGVILVLMPLPIYLHQEKTPDFQEDITTAMAQYSINGTILSSDPALLSLAPGNKVALLSGLEFAPEVYRRYQQDYELIYLNECDLVCFVEDTACLEQKKNFIGKVEAENNEIWRKEFIFKNKNIPCRYRMFMPK